MLFRAPPAQAAAALQARGRYEHTVSNRRTGAAGVRALQARRRCRHAGAADTQAREGCTAEQS
jgi:hypothetical protein